MKINVGRVLLGGLVAGVVYNIGEAILNMKILAQAMLEFNQKFNLPPADGGFIAKMTLLMFGFGIVTVLLYALIRPRLGPGVKTAVVAGVLVWFLSFFYSGLLNGLLGFFAPGPTLLALSWELVEASLAAVAGAWLYKEA
jgi:hypothetical protein